MELKNKEPKMVNILKEDRQAFGVLIGKVTNESESLRYPLTSVPLALATPDRDLRQGSKAVLRNFLMEDSNCTADHPSVATDWFVDGMAAIRAVPRQDTWDQDAERLL